MWFLISFILLLSQGTSNYDLWAQYYVQEGCTVAGPMVSCPWFDGSQPGSVWIPAQ